MKGELFEEDFSDKSIDYGRFQERLKNSFDEIPYKKDTYKVGWAVAEGQQE